jgi:hypothetical protein
VPALFCPGGIQIPDISTNIAVYKHLLAKRINNEVILND